MFRSITCRRLHCISRSMDVSNHASLKYNISWMTIAWSASTVEKRLRKTIVISEHTTFCVLCKIFVKMETRRKLDVAAAVCSLSFHVSKRTTAKSDCFNWRTPKYNFRYFDQLIKRLERVINSWTEIPASLKINTFKE